MKFDPIKIIQKYYEPKSDLYNLLVVHSELVTKKALEAAKNVPNLKPDLDFIQEAGMLHDIGIFLVNAPDIGCIGDKPYICHGYLGRELLEKEGLPKHALVCERHTGVGIDVESMVRLNLPIPHRDMIPLSIEEKIICYADKYFSKNPASLTKIKSVEEIRTGLLKFGESNVLTFNQWLKQFES